MFVRRASRGLMRAAASASSAPAAPGITGPRATLAGSGVVDAHTVPPHLRSRRLGLRRGDAVVTAVAGARGYNGGVNGGDRGGDGAPRPPARPARVEFLGEETAPAAPAGNPRGRPGARGKRSTSTGKRPGASLGYHRVHVRPLPRPSGRRPPEDAPRAGRPRARDRVRVGVRVETSAAAHLPRPPRVAAHLPRPPRGSSPPPRKPPSESPPSDQHRQQRPRHLPETPPAASVPSSLPPPPPPPRRPPVPDRSPVALRDVLMEKGIVLQSYTPGQHRIVCPSCGGGSNGERSLAVRIEDDGAHAAWMCHRATCEWTGGTSVTDARGGGGHARAEASEGSNTHVGTGMRRGSGAAAARRSFLLPTRSSAWVPAR